MTLSIPSINEPDASRLKMIMPASANEPFNPANYTPTLASISPTTAAHASGNKTITFTGTNFIDGLTRVVFAGVNMKPVVASATSLSIVVDSSKFVAGAVTTFVQNTLSYVSPPQTFTWT